MNLPRRFGKSAAVLAVSLVLVADAHAQFDVPHGVDQRLLYRVNQWETKLARGALGNADRTAYPVYYAVLPAVWAPVVLSGANNDAAVRMSVGVVGSYVAVVGLKRLVSRARPNTVHDWVISRPEYPGSKGLDPHSWPSGHATLASAIAVTAALADGRWQVAVPVGSWAVAVGVSRVWLGVHYPSDVLSGWILGAGTALLVHQLRNNDGDTSLSAVPLFRFSLPLG